MDRQPIHNNAQHGIDAVQHRQLGHRQDRGPVQSLDEMRHNPNHRGEEVVPYHVFEILGKLGVNQAVAGLGGVEDQLHHYDYHGRRYKQ